jgi:iron(III) transport system substrate-binding protein
LLISSSIRRIKLAKTASLPSRAVIAALFALALALAGGGCNRSQAPLTIYSGRTENLVGPLLNRFAEETNISIDVRYGDSAELALLLSEEAGRSNADVFLSQSPGPMSFLAAKGLLAKLDETVLDRAAEGSEDPEGRWVGTTGRIRVLVYNREMVRESDLPKSIFELSDPKYERKVAVAPTNASFQDAVTAMRHEVGDSRTLSWLKGLVANSSPTYANNNAIVEAVGRGEVPLGLVNHYYNFRFLEEDPDLPSRNHIFPDGDLGSLLLTSPVAILESTDDADRARRFIEFLLSEQAQEYFRDETFEYPLAAGVQPSHDLPPLEALHLPVYRVEGEDLERTTELIAESGLER